MSATDIVQKHSVHTLVFRSLKRTHDMFVSDATNLPPLVEEGERVRHTSKCKSEYGLVMEAAKNEKRRKQQEQMRLPMKDAPIMDPSNTILNQPLAITGGETGSMSNDKALSIVGGSSSNEGVKALLPRKAPTVPKPSWHPPWKLYRVISGHTGWVRCVDVEPGNEWFATGAADRIIKIWDLASGKLKLSLTGHVSTVRGVKISTRHPYLFSCGEDKQVKCWDLEYNKVVRHYHGHLSAVYDLALHPTLDVLVTASRDSTARVWDMRTKAQVHCLTGHTNTVASVVCQSAHPQVITGSHDSTIRLWDLAAGRSITTLTHHKKSIRGLAIHPTMYMFASASPDNIKQWKCPDGDFIQNLSGHNAIINSLAINEDNVMVSAADNGSMQFWDFKSGVCFQKLQSLAQSGSIDSEAGIFAVCFDQSKSRLITAEADKTIKLYKEDETATEESHPILWRPDILKKKAY